MMKTVELKKNEVCYVLPCNIGDKVKIFTDSISGVKESVGYVQRFEISETNLMIKTSLGMFNAGELGRTLFLADEKEEALEEREE